MLEGIAANLLSRYLGKYIDGLSKENLNVSLGAGDLVLENLQLKQDALDDLELPVQVCGGTLGRLKLKIPWKRLKSEPAVIRLEDLFILVAPRSTSDTDTAARKERTLKIKRRNLQLAELMESKSSGTAEEEKGEEGSGYLSSYTSLIINNLQIYIDRVHIRYEDQLSSPGNPFVMGVTLEEIHAVTTNEDWESSFLSSSVSAVIVHKLVSLKNLAIYWNSGVRPTVFKNQKKMKKRMAEWIHTDENPQSHHYLLKPINATLKVVLNRDPLPDMEIPKMTLSFVFDQIGLSLSSAQYRDLLDTMEYFQRCNRYGKYSHHRPTVSITRDPLAYWRFVILCKQEEVHKRLRRWKWSSMRRMKKRRIEYIDLYCRKKRGKKNALTPEQVERLQYLEDKLEYETVLLFRSLAQKYLEKDQAYVASRKQEMAQQTEQSWFGRVWNYVPGSGTDASLQLTDDIMKEIYQELDTEEEKPLAVNLPPDYVKMRIHFELEQGSLQLRNNSNSLLASANFDGFYISLEKRPDSMSFSGNLVSMGVTDHSTKDTQFPQLISPGSKTSQENAEEDPYFFTIMADVNPLDSFADYRLLLSTRPLNVIISKSFINRVINFFNKPITRIRRRKMAELNVRAYTRLQEIRQQTEAQLMQAMAQRKVFDVHVHLSAPTVIIPRDVCDPQTATLVLVLGTLSISSDLREKERHRQIMQEGGDTLSSLEGFEELARLAQEQKEESADRSETDFGYLYDKFFLSLTSLEAGITRNALQLDGGSTPLGDNLIEKFDVNLYLEVCNLESYELSKIILSGTLPSLRLNVSPEKTMSIMKILNTLNRRSPSQSLEAEDFSVVEEDTREQSSQPNPSAPSLPEHSEETTLEQKARKKQMQIRFSIPEASVLFSEGDVQIALFHLKGISATYLKRPFDVQVTLILHGMVIEDRLQPWGEDFRYLASSETLSPLSHSTMGQDDLICVDYYGVQPIAPHFDNVNHKVNFRFHKVYVTMNRETIIKLVGCVKHIQQSLKREAMDTTASELAPPKLDESPIEEPEKEPPVPIPRDRVLFEVQAQVRDISLLMNDTGVKIGIIQLRHSAFGFKLRPDTVRVEGKLGQIRIQDLDPGSARYPEMFEATDHEEMVFFSYETFVEGQPNFPGYGVRLFIKINQLRYMWIERFQLRVRSYFSEISEMQKILSNTASSAAAAMMKPKRLFCYEIQLNNPHIVIPQHVDAERCLIIDLGRILIEKQFPINEAGVRMTRIWVDVKAMNWQTGMLHKGPFRAILDNTDLQLWWEKPEEEAIQETHEYPGLNVWVYFPLLHIILSEHQSYQICGTVAQNICCPPTAHEIMVQEKKQQLREQHAEDGKLSETLAILNNTSLAQEEPPPPDPEDFQFQPEDEKWVEMHIDFHVDKWVIEALRDSGEDEAGHTRVGDLEVLHWDMQYTTYSNGSHLGIFIMPSMKIYDRRLNNPSHFKEILTPLSPDIRKLNPSDEHCPPNIVGAWANKNNQWECRYERGADGYTDMSYSWDHCYFMAVPDAIFDIYDVVKPVIFDDIVPAVDIWRVWKNPNPQMVVPPSHQSMKMKMKMSITSSELFLLEDPSAIHTQSLVIRSTFSILFTRDNRANTRNWCVMVDRMESFKCRLGTEEPVVAIMQPLNWCVDVIGTEQKSNIIFDLEPMVFYFSYKDYLTCKHIIDNWLPWLSGRTPRERIKPAEYQSPYALDALEEEAGKQETSEEEEEAAESSEEADKELEFASPARDDTLPVLDEENHLHEGLVLHEAQLSPDRASINLDLEDMDATLSEASLTSNIRAAAASAAEEPSPLEVEEQSDAPTEQQLVVRTGGFKFILIDDSTHNHNNPLANIVMDNFNVELSNWSSAMKVLVVSGLRVDYFHTKLEVWEPVIEPWSFQFLVSRSPIPHPMTKYRVYASKRCEINITAAMIETTLNTIEAISNREDAAAAELPPILDPYIIRNETGLMLSYWLSNEEEYRLFDLEPDQERPIKDEEAIASLQRKRAKRTEGGLPSSVNVSLIVSGEYTPVKNIPIEKVGTYITRVSPVERNAWLSCEVSFRTGSKVLTVKSNIRITNHTVTPLEAIAVVEYKDSVILDPIAPGDTASIPLAFAPSGTMQIRPSSSFRWNEGELLLYKIHRLKRQRFVKCFSLRRPQSDTDTPSMNEFFYSIHLTTSHSGKIHHVNVYPPLCMENLLPIVMEFRIIHKHSKVTLHNATIQKGETQYIHDVNPQQPLTLSVKIPCFGWSKPEDINSGDPSEVLRLLDEVKRTLSLRVLNLVEVNGMRKISVFAQYWMVNHTGLRLLYRRSGFDNSLAAGQEQQEKRTVVLGDHPRDWYREDESEAPFLFTTPFYNFDPRGDLVRIKMANSKWSQNLNLNSQGTTCVFEIPDNQEEGRQSIRSFCLCMTVSAGHDIFWRTRIVSLFPRFIIVNDLDREFVYHQRGTNTHLCSIRPGENLPFHWADMSARRHICIRLNEEGWQWSGGFKIGELGSFSLKLRHEESENYFLVRIRVKVDQASTLVIVSPENTEFPNYQIENITPMPLRISQIHSKHYDILQPHQKVPYAWDLPMAPHKVEFAFEGYDEHLEVSLDHLTSYVPIRVGSSRIHISVHANGPTKVLTVEMVKNEQLASTHWEEQLADLDKKKNAEQMQMEFQVAIQGIGLSIIDETPLELSYITVTKIHMSLCQSNLYRTADFSIGWLQVDNQLYQTPYPVVIYPVSAANTDRYEDAHNVFFDVTACLSREVTSITYFKSFCAVLQKIDLKLDEEFVLHTMKFVQYITDFFKKRRERSQKAEEERVAIDVEGDATLANALRKSGEVDELIDKDTKVQRRFGKYNLEKASTQGSKFIYFEELLILPIKVNFSFANVPGAVRDQDTMISRILSRGGILANFDSAPLVLGKLELAHPFSSRSEMLDRISKHYMNSAIREFHKMLGSADFLGSPISFVRTMGTGFYDFFNEPRQHMDNPMDFGVGVARGTQSLIKHSTWGAFNSAAKLTSTIGKGAASLTFDKPYVREREVLSREKPLHVFQGIAFGLRDFGLGCVQGVGGVVYEPLRGAYDDRFSGMVKGVGRGVIGLGLKPAIGVVDLFTRTAEGVRNTATYWDEIRRGRVRHPRYFGRDKVLETFSDYKSVGQELLYTLEHGRYRNEFYMHHIEEETTIIIISDLHILTVSRFDTKQEDWHVKISEICGVGTDKRGVLLHLSDYIASSVFESPTHKRVIFCRSQNRQEVYKVILYWLQILKHPSIAAE